MPTQENNFQLASALCFQPLETAPLWSSCFGHLPTRGLFPTLVLQRLGPDFTRPNRTGLACPVTVGKCLQNGLESGLCSHHLPFPGTFFSISAFSESAVQAPTTVAHVRSFFAQLPPKLSFKDSRMTFSSRKSPCSPFCTPPCPPPNIQHGTHCVGPSQVALPGRYTQLPAAGSASSKDSQPSQLSP